MQEKDSILTVENRKKISYTGVESVDAFSDTSIRLTVLGKSVRIDGTHLKILSFSQGSGAFTAIGEVSSVRFGGGAKSRLARLFK